MKLSIRSLLFLPILLAASVAFAVPSMKVTVFDARGKVAFQGATNSNGTFTTGEVFLADGKFGSQANFDRIDLSNATYFDFGPRHWVFARQTRYGQERSFGDATLALMSLPVP